MSGIYASLRQAQILILEILYVFLWLIRLRWIAFLELEQKLPFFKGLTFEFDLIYIISRSFISTIPFPD